MIWFFVTILGRSASNGVIVLLNRAYVRSRPPPFSGLQIGKIVGTGTDPVMPEYILLNPPFHPEQEPHAQNGCQNSVEVEGMRIVLDDKSSTMNVSSEHVVHVDGLLNLDLSKLDDPCINC